MPAWSSGLYYMHVGPVGAGSNHWMVLMIPLPIYVTSLLPMAMAVWHSVS